MASMIARAFGGPGHATAGAANVAGAGTHAHAASMAAVDAMRMGAPTMPYGATIVHDVTPGFARMPIEEAAQPRLQSVLGLAGTGDGVVAWAARAGVLVRSGSAVHLAGIERTLSEGVPLPMSVRRTMIAHGAGVLAAVDVINPANAGEAIRGFRKPAAQAAQEQFGWDLLRTMRADHIGAPAAMRADGSVFIAAVDGAPMGNEGIRSYGDFESAQRAWYDANMPQLSEADRAQAARVDRQVLQVLDWLTANSDRSPGNGIANRATFDARAIDWGNVGMGESVDPLRPKLNPSFTDAGDRLVLDQATVDVLRTRLGPDVLAQLHTKLAGRVSHVPVNPAFDETNAYVGSGAYLSRMQQRLAHVLEHGWIEGASDEVRYARKGDLT